MKRLLAVALLPLVVVLAGVVGAQPAAAASRTAPASSPQLPSCSTALVIVVTVVDVQPENRVKAISVAAGTRVSDSTSVSPTRIRETGDVRTAIVVGATPVNLVDPSGHDPCADCNGQVCLPSDYECGGGGGSCADLCTNSGTEAPAPSGGGSGSGTGASAGPGPSPDALDTVTYTPPPPGFTAMGFECVHRDPMYGDSSTTPTTCAQVLPESVISRGYCGSQRLDGSFRTCTSIGVFYGASSDGDWATRFADHLWHVFAAADARRECTDPGGCGCKGLDCVPALLGLGAGAAGIMVGGLRGGEPEDTSVSPEELVALIARAREMRDALAADIGSSKATVIGGINVRTGDIGAGMNGPVGTCAETNVCNALGGNPDDVFFVEPIRPRTGWQVPVCAQCQKTFSPDQFVRGTQFQGEAGVWIWWPEVNTAG